MVSESHVGFDQIRDQWPWSTWTTVLDIQNDVNIHTSDHASREARPVEMPNVRHAIMHMHNTATMTDIGHQADLHVQNEPWRLMWTSTPATKGTLAE